jgi:bifunctional non-homologous end joining protein LigD
MGLKEYEKKRDFKKTSEPTGGKSTGKKLAFVVQRHHASHLHYDFRLELDGVLKSWAVPKGPSMNPDDKRLAMMVEDHPYDYRTFEGIIPQGEYGGGIVIVWDEGTYESLAESRADDVKALHQGLHSGNLKFRLNGNILKGEFALVKLHTDEKSWLLIKHRDEFAVDTPYNSEDFVADNIKELLNNKGAKVSKLPKHKSAANIAHKSTPKEKGSKRQPDDTPVSNEAEDDSDDSAPRSNKAYTPMMAKLESKLFEDDDWLYERKLDGYRAIGYTGKKAKLISRNGIDFGNKYEQVLDDLKQISTDAILDGELVLEDDKGNSRFQDIQNYASTKSKLHLKYYVFDLLNLNGHDLRNLELIKRKELLQAFVAQLPKDTSIFYNGHEQGKGKKLMERAKKEAWEGIIGKDSHSTYESGRRSDRWLKFKLQNSQEAIICGFSKPQGGRHHLGSLILGMNEGDHIRYIGNCGTGFNDTTLKEVYEKLKPLITDEKPFKEKPHQRTKITWVKPQLICEVYYSEWTGDKHLRHPVFKGLREDKDVKNVIMETPEKQLAHEETLVYGEIKFKASHLNKVFWKQEGITKGELIHYYRDMSSYILPFLKDKPLSMRRQPNGIDDPGFFQKDVGDAHLPSWIQTKPLYSESNSKDINFIIANDEATLLYVVNLGSIEINPWLSPYQTPDNPDFVVIDIDPHDVPFSQTIEAALVTKAVFDEMGLDVYIKTSGSKGLHIYCYLGGQYDYDFVKMFAEYVAHLVHSQLPATTSIERSPAKRPNKIYIDFLQNRRGQTIAAPYSVRPKPGATVSTPIYWDEVNKNLKLSDYTMDTVRERVKSIEDPWKNLKSKKADLKKALEKLQGEGKP